MLVLQTNICHRDITSSLDNRLNDLLFILVLQSIEERREFLREMEQLGQGKQYRTLIETEISQVRSQTF